MDNLKFRYKEHPGDFYRSSNKIELPDSEKDLENFLIQFLRNFQTDERITYIDDLYKLLDNDFFYDEDKIEFLNNLGITNSEKEIKKEIQIVEQELKKEAFQNFYNLVFSNKIEIFINGEK